MSFPDEFSGLDEFSRNRSGSCPGNLPIRVQSGTLLPGRADFLFSLVMLIFVGLLDITWICMMVF